MRTCTTGLILGVICAGMWGCGGAGGDTCGDGGSTFFAGGDSGSGDDSGSSQASPAEAVRANAAGDSFTYAVTRRYSQTGGAQQLSTSGTSSEAFTASTFGGEATLLDATTTVLQLRGGQTTIEDAKQRGTTGLTVGQFEAGTMQAVTSGGFMSPASLSSSTALNTTETLTDGTAVTISFKVVGTTNVTTPAGNFDAWQISESLAYSDGTTSKIDLDFAPAIGAPVQEHQRNSYSSGLSDSVTLKLSKYTLGGP